MGFVSVRMLQLDSAVGCSERNVHVATNPLLERDC